jgi:hypothetical protein
MSSVPDRGASVNCPTCHGKHTLPDPFTPGQTLACPACQPLRPRYILTCCEEYVGEADTLAEAVSEARAVADFDDEMVAIWCGFRLVAAVDCRGHIYRLRRHCGW